MAGIRRPTALCVATEICNDMAGKSWTLLSFAFRPFFLLGALFAIVAVLAWLALLHGTGWAPAVTDPAAGWIAAFGLFLAAYWPILTQPRGSN